jgi:hypothetical protein
MGGLYSVSVPIDGATSGWLKTLKRTSQALAQNEPFRVLAEIPGPSLDLQSDKLAGRSAVFSQFHLGVYAKVENRLFSEDPAEVIDDYSFYRVNPDTLSF